MNKIKLIGFDNLGENGNDGIRYAWSVNDNRNILESASFFNKTKDTICDISGYTTSVSLGCVLRHLGCACKFCRTGNLLPFVRFLSAKEIAKQNILMVLADMHNEEHIEVKSKKREFAYMGQGEPGYSYSQLRMAIKMTDYIMNNALKQEVHRHIVATSGVPEMLYNLATDLKYNYYDSHITLHYSLHAAENRDFIMPINNMYGFKDIVEILKNIGDITEEKVCLGVLLFNEFRPKNSLKTISTSIDSLKSLLDIIDTEHFRFSFCEYNTSEDLGEANLYPMHEAQKINNFFVNAGYETKLFFSFGRKEQSACGMLAGKTPTNLTSSKFKELESLADSLIETAWKKILKS